MNYVVLDSGDFKREYAKAFVEQPLHSDEERALFRDQVFELQGEILEALKRKWKEHDDFEVGWNFNYCFHACGGIYSEAAFSAEYVRVVAAALARVDKEGRWTYHTVAEILVNPTGKTIGEMIEARGEFFIRGDCCFLSGDMLPPHRTALGCSI